MTYEFQLWPSIDIGQFDGIVIIINKIEKLPTLLIWSLECYFPDLN